MCESESGCAMANIGHQSVPERSNLVALDELTEFSSLSRADLAAQVWDAVIIGAGHNGLTCAAYLAQPQIFRNSEAIHTGDRKKILILESQPRVGGACTLRRFSTDEGDLVMSPCAYLAGLLHNTVVDELDLVARGLKWTAATGGLFTQFDDGTSIMLYDEPIKLEAELRRLTCSADDGDDSDVRGYFQLIDLMHWMRDTLRPDDSSLDIWVGSTAPTREMIEKRLQGNQIAINVMFEWSMDQLLRHFLKSEKLISLLLGQGVLGTFASPSEPGTAYVFFHHYCGRMMHQSDSGWGYIEGGMGMISRLIFERCCELGIETIVNAPVKTILPGQGVILDDGTVILSQIVVCNCAPSTIKKLLLGSEIPSAWLKQVDAIPAIGSSAKVNLILRKLPTFKHQDRYENLYLSQVNLPLTIHQWDAATAAVRQGQIPERLFCEIYFQTAVDNTISTRGLHSMSILVQHVPYLTDWTAEHREHVWRIVRRQLEEVCADLQECIVRVDVMGPRDIETDLGMAGGHLFHGDIRGQFMWNNRLSYQIDGLDGGVYLCGSSTNPGGSVIAVNGRNCAQYIIEARPDLF